MKSILIKNASLVADNKTITVDILIEDNFIQQITERQLPENKHTVINADGLLVLPGIIDDQVHFREPGLTSKGDIYSESKAAIAGGITSFMEMPNTIPQTTTLDLLEKKYELASEKSLANYSFYMGANNDNISEIVKIDPKTVCGLKVFMGASTGNMLVDNKHTLEKIFAESPILITTHCEDESIIQQNILQYKGMYGENVPINCHPKIRSEEACYRSSALAVELASKYGAQLHVLHLSTAKELQLFDNKISIQNKKITAEVCVHHLWFDNTDYERLGSMIKWNPAIKTPADKLALMDAINNNTLDIIATDHAPHTFEEKQNSYFKAPSGGPLVQHSLVAMLELYKQGKIKLEKIIEKMCHNPAILYNIEKRGFIKEDYYADLVLVDLNNKWTVSKDNILYKCGWSPFEGNTFTSSITYTIVNGNIVYQNGKFDDSIKGQRLTFDR